MVYTIVLSPTVVMVMSPSQTDSLADTPGFTGDTSHNAN